ncbi:MAG TPA: TonB-dependent receptor [Chitinophagaceae bacterium]|nr:TonB-dependent receptor [Chitinophagaceae bacterium]
MKKHYRMILRMKYLLLLLLPAFSLQAQTGIPGLYIVNKATKVPVQDAFIQNVGGTFSALSDENGFVNLQLMPDTVMRLSVSCIGFEPMLLDLRTLPKTGHAVTIGLTARISTLQEVKVSATSGNRIFKTISDLDIHLRPINNSQEVLRLVPGLFIGQHAGGGKAEQLFLRGFDLDHGTDINISADGIPVNMVSHAHGQGYADLHFIIPELIEKVSFNKGPYFADKGNFTTAGYVAFKTKDYLADNFIKTEAGQFHTFRTIAGLNFLPVTGTRRTQSLYAAVEASYTKGYFDHPQDFTRFNGLLKYHGSLNEKNTLTASLSGFTSKWNASGQIPDRAVESGMIDFYGAIDSTEGGRTSRYNGNIELLTNLPDGVTVRNQVYYSRYAFELYSNFTFFKEDTVNGDQIRQKEARDIIGYNGSYVRTFYAGQWKTTTDAGVQLRYDLVHDIELTRTKDRVINTAELMLGNIREFNAGAYWSQRLYLTNRLDITGAVRMDYFSNWYDNKLQGDQLSAHAAIVSPKLNFNYRLNEHVQLYFYNGRGFHSNDTRVVVQEGGRRVLPPAYGSDLGGLFKIGKKLVVQAAGWYLWLDQEFVYVGDEGVVEPGGKTRRIGLDLSARYQLLKNLYADVDINVANPRAIGESRGNNYLPLAPRFTSVGGLTYRKEKGWNGSLRYRYMADRPANEDNSVVAKGYFVTDAAVNYTSRKWEAGLAIQNLLNVKWKETQFDTESRLQNEPAPVSEIHFTPGTPFFARVSFTFFF